MFHYFWRHPAWWSHKSLPFLSRLMMCTDTKVRKISISMFVHKNISGFNVSMNLPLFVEIQKTLYDFFHYGSKQNFILNSLLKFGVNDIMHWPSSKKRHNEPKIRIIDKWNIVANDVLVTTLRHNLNFFSNIIHITILKQF